MNVMRRDVPPLVAWRCPDCGQLHRDFDRECMYECGAELEEVEVVPASLHRGAVAGLARLANPTHRPRSEEAWLLQAEVVQIAQATLDALGGGS